MSTVVYQWRECASNVVIKTTIHRSDFPTLAVCGCRIVTDTKCVPDVVAPAPRCPYGTHEVATKENVCSCAPHKPLAPGSMGSLIFVIDDTGSMASVIKGVKDQINAIISANKLFRNYVMATFGDPYVKNVIKSVNASEIRIFLDKVVASGGGDCPEYAMSGIRDAVDVADSDSVLFLFTDASAKDASDQSIVANQLVAKRVRFITVASGNLCSTPGDEYKFLANKTEGQVANLAATLTTNV